MSLLLSRQPSPPRTPEDYTRMLARFVAASAPAPAPEPARTRLISSDALLFRLVERDERPATTTARHNLPSCNGVGGVCSWRCIQDPDDADRKRRIPTFCERHREAKRALDRENVKRRRMAQSAE